SSDVLPFGRLWYGDTNAVANAVGYAMHSSRSHDAVIRVYDEAGTWSRRTSIRATLESGEVFRNCAGCRDRDSECARDREPTGCRKGRRVTQCIRCSTRPIARPHLDTDEVLRAFAFQL